MILLVFIVQLYRWSYLPPIVQRITFLPHKKYRCPRKQINIVESELTLHRIDNTKQLISIFLFVYCYNISFLHFMHLPQIYVTIGKFIHYLHWLYFGSNVSRVSKIRIANRCQVSFLSQLIGSDHMQLWVSALADVKIIWGAFKNWWQSHPRSVSECLEVGPGIFKILPTILMNRPG